MITIHINVTRTPRANVNFVNVPIIATLIAMPAITALTVNVNVAWAT